MACAISSASLNCKSHFSTATKRTPQVTPSRRLLRTGGRHKLTRARSDMMLHCALMNTDRDSFSPPRSCSVTSSCSSESLSSSASSNPFFNEVAMDVMLSKSQGKKPRKLSLPLIMMQVAKRATPSPNEMADMLTPPLSAVAYQLPNIGTAPNTTTTTTIVTLPTHTATPTATTPSPRRTKSLPGHLTLQLPSITPPPDEPTDGRLRSKSLSERRGRRSISITMPSPVKNDEDTRADVTNGQDGLDTLFTQATQLIRTCRVSNPEALHMIEKIRADSLSPTKSADWVTKELMQYMESSFAV